MFKVPNNNDDKEEYVTIGVITRRLLDGKIDELDQKSGMLD